MRNPVKKTLALILGSTLVGCPTQKETLESVTQESIAMLTAPDWCFPCQKQEPIFSKLKFEYPEVDFRVMNVGAGLERNKYEKPFPEQINGVPTYIKADFSGETPTYHLLSETHWDGLIDLVHSMPDVRTYPQAASPFFFDLDRKKARLGYTVKGNDLPDDAWFILDQIKKGKDVSYVEVPGSRGAFAVNFNLSNPEDRRAYISGGKDIFRDDNLEARSTGFNLSRKLWEDLREKIISTKIPYDENLRRLCDLTNYSENKEDITGLQLIDVFDIELLGDRKKPGISVERNKELQEARLILNNILRNLFLSNPEINTPIFSTFYSQDSLFPFLFQDIGNSYSVISKQELEDWMSKQQVNDNDFTQKRDYQLLMERRDYLSGLFDSASANGIEYVNSSQRLSQIVNEEQQEMTSRNIDIYVSLPWKNIPALKDTIQYLASLKENDSLIDRLVIFDSADRPFYFIPPAAEIYGAGGVFGNLLNRATNGQQMIVFDSDYSAEVPLISGSYVLEQTDFKGKYLPQARNKN